MVPIIQTFKNDKIVDIRSGKFYENLQSICTEHKLENRALAFAFLLYNPENPQMNKVLHDQDYWQALHEYSGKFLSIFYIPQQENYFGEDLINSDGKEKRYMYPVHSSQELIPILKNYFELDEKIELPAVLFFQENEGLLTDYFLLKLDEEKIEESFLELYQYIKTVVHDLKGIKQEYYGNSKEIFEILKSGVKGQKLKRKIFNITQKFPIRLLVGWLVGKI